MLLTISTQSIVLVDGERLTVCTSDDLVNVWYAAISMNGTSSYSHSHLNEVLGSSAVQYFHALVALGRRPETPTVAHIINTGLTAVFQLNVCLPILSLGLWRQSAHILHAKYLYCHHQCLRTKINSKHGPQHPKITRQANPFFIH